MDLNINTTPKSKVIVAKNSMYLCFILYALGIVLDVLMFVLFSMNLKPLLYEF